jgi:hypothetical protein
VDALEELPIDHEKEDVAAMCPWRAYKEEVLVQMFAPGQVQIQAVGTGDRWLAGPSCHGNDTA